MRFVAISAVFSASPTLKKVFAEAKDYVRAGKQTLLFVDEIHRFNRAQQDGFLPYVENGTVVLVGATTENPSFELNAALLSRAQVLILNRLDGAALGQLLERAEALMDRRLPLTADARDALLATADGDGRFLLNQAETLFSVHLDAPLDPAGLSALLHRRVAVYDKDREGHYNLISALHKAMRGSDPLASLYYLARMLTAGRGAALRAPPNRPLRFGRHRTRDPQASGTVPSGEGCVSTFWIPEGELAIVQACLYCATAPKSNAAYVAQKSAWRSARETGSLMPPKNILNAPTKLMKQVGYGKGYSYDTTRPKAFPATIIGRGNGPQIFLQSVDRGFEKKIAERLAWWDEQRGSLRRAARHLLDLCKQRIKRRAIVEPAIGDDAPDRGGVANVLQRVPAQQDEIRLFSH
jgi:putative ATPase